MIIVETLITSPSIFDLTPHPLLTKIWIIISSVYIIENEIVASSLETFSYIFLEWISIDIAAICSETLTMSTLMCLLTSV